MSATMQLEENVVTRLQKGNQQSFEEIYDKYSDSLYGLILRIVKQEDLAQDILQDCFVKIWQKAPSYDPSKGTIFTWMLNICRNKSIDSLRKTSREKTDNGIELERLDTGAENININTIGLKDILNNLSDDKRQIIEYLYFKGYTQQETADELDIPLGTVKTRSRGAIRDLKEYFTLILAFWISKNI